MDLDSPNDKNMTKKHPCFILLVLALSAQLMAAELPETSRDTWLDDEPEFLKVDEAFVLSTEVAADGAILARWEMPG